MYIWTADLQILNLDHYARVTARHWDGNTYTLLAGTGSSSRIIIARFDNLLDAEYANCLLFKALIDHAGAWDATAVDSLSQNWEDVKKFYDAEDPLVVDLLTHSEMGVTGLQEVTILYSSECHQRFPETFHDLRQKLEEKLALDVDIKWEPTDDIPW